jgi:3-deoxy-7-phosphoheptulonate synthase
VVGNQLDFSYLDKAAEQAHRQTGPGEADKTAIMGEVGTFSHNACIQYFGDDMPVEPKPSYRALFEAVKTGETRYGVIPLENSLTGSIHENYDLLLEYDLLIVGELTLRIIHHLIGKPGTPTDRIKRVMAPSQAMDQCRRFLDQHQDWQFITVNATGSAVKAISKLDGDDTAAIGSSESARLFGMSVLESGIETNPRNYTRFAVIAAEARTNGERKKSSLVYSTGNQPGALYETLKIFTENRINLVKLESRPIHGKPWEYMFYADIEADATRASFRPILDAIRKKADFLKVLGAY